LHVDTIFLDHSGTTLPAKSLIDHFAFDVQSTLLGNPHSASIASQTTSRRIDDIRLRVLRFFQADPQDYDVAFVQNATAGIKIVAEAFRDTPGDDPKVDSGGFRYLYHKESHTSLVGARELALGGHVCLESDEKVDLWLSGQESPFGQLEPPKPLPQLFAYPAQSNLNGRRLPLSWTRTVHGSSLPQHKRCFTLLDAAALVSTSALDLSCPEDSADFIVLSFYKIFGFPDLGALVIKRDSAHALRHRRYFGGGTVQSVACQQEQWHQKKQDNPHDMLEDGTVPFHSIIALDSAIRVHEELYYSMANVSNHVTHLAKNLHTKLESLRHCNGERVCTIYKDQTSDHGDQGLQGPTIAMNIRNARGAWISNSEVEKLATIRNIQLRTGGVCNPGGTAACLDLSPWELKKNFSAGHRCGNEVDIIQGKPTGVIRVSLGAMSNQNDIDIFIAFIQEFFQESRAGPRSIVTDQQSNSTYQIERLAIYPIKSCGGWAVPANTPWPIKEEGLAWDREWCLVHIGTEKALSQKKHPKMALLRPIIDLESGLLRVRLFGSLLKHLHGQAEIHVPLSADPAPVKESIYCNRDRPSQVCGDDITALIYQSAQIEDFFTKALGVPCTLARFPAGGSGSSTRSSKARLQNYQLQRESSEFQSNISRNNPVCRPILLANESPILTITRSSLNRLNEQIKANGGKAAEPEVFRANIIIAEDDGRKPGAERPYVEDSWRFLRIGKQYFQMLGACRRCQIVCVDQATAEKNQEPFVTLAKTRRFDGKVFFGQHTCYLHGDVADTRDSQNPMIRVGDPVRTFVEGDLLDVELQNLLER
jgi:molybdenum cofactor sulfurtransferase